MTAQTEFDPLREANELRSQLASEKRRLAFLFGAGTSQSVGLDGLAGLTAAVGSDLKADDRKAYEGLLQLDKPGNLETVLNRLRLCRELVGVDESRTIDGITGKQAIGLERLICGSVQQRVSNSRLAVTALLFDAIASENIQRNLIDPTLGVRNLTVYAPDGASIGGRQGVWKEPKEALPASLTAWPFWDDTTKRFTMGDFRNFVEFLRVFMGVRTPELPVHATEAAPVQAEAAKSASPPPQI